MPRKNAQRSGSPLYWSAESWAFISFRLFLSLLMLTAGLGKFKNQEGDYSFSAYYNGVVNWIVSTFEKTDLPGFLVSLYAYSIGYLEILLGLLLLLGVKTKWVLALIALTLVSLAYGQMLLGTQESGTAVSQISIYLLVTAAALYFVRHNKFESLR
ncbi:DoxX family membrane protein [Pelagicoccus sp. NFK12]|uniref:DoxX family membrane protein n=1 Tax=Pelagicoccus enzymogenes TaxID=2773457 RepID=A0A927IJ82_9BACT|nr:DoxX family membrane protein [Pelagicoccus enzymogenes]MBD5781589.1 DoxX family membrane protein [Pelagicoccus enzymogenes]MDQ8200070.1 DoxX family membrane protein [Pelagicoccus enzymogenes]